MITRRYPLHRSIQENDDEMIIRLYHSFHIMVTPSNSIIGTELPVWMKPCMNGTKKKPF